VSLGGRLLKLPEIYFSSFFLKGSKKMASPDTGENQTCQFDFTEGERLRNSFKKSNTEHLEKQSLIKDS